MKNTIILFAAALVISLASCQKSLNITNPDAVGTTQFWKNANDAQVTISFMLFMRFLYSRFGPQHSDSAPSHRPMWSV